MTNKNMSVSAPRDNRFNWEQAIEARYQQKKQGCSIHPETPQCQSLFLAEKNFQGRIEQNLKTGK